ncbi:hypothetical protein ACSCB1_32170 [Streptomyces europaeiscabiei]|uniref:Uncharacterized protein n=1 Tax=Streptomyces europaeiscabiei TaxID=146819 RepID=A0ABU4NQK7_9ACTN|nr:hypothetical protein [Streptomyces europaeiscabiei]MDX2528952.1 hypothetical protein [Streptomyces europaeiscabiei]MDX2759381.1 hypothetical protein [Streptomyces europaeiscabiei]MDX3546741.1 hypothetical protein [Streptomyces europaeiscabiei]MDX3556435.1 hypothetical protein [Streptomyces europaeiscabiei]MDX3671338.1 hypothetical protein [Streptomyces europaeiscabiei]
MALLKNSELRAERAVQSEPDSIAAALLEVRAAVALEKHTRSHGPPSTGEIFRTKSGLDRSRTCRRIARGVDAGNPTAV